MNITTFNPSVITKDAESTIKLFEEMGFQQTPQQGGKCGCGDFGPSNEERGRLPRGRCGDAVIPQTYSAIRINVDNSEEAYAFFY